MKKYSLIVSIALAVALITLLITFSIISQLKKEAASNTYWQQQREHNFKIAVTLAHKSWYVIDEFTVSSEKDGQGQIVNLPQRLIGKGNSFVRIHVTNNAKIMFVQDEKQIYRMTDYLTYQFENEKELLGGWR